MQSFRSSKNTVQKDLNKVTGVLWNFTVQKDLNKVTGVLWNFILRKCNEMNTVFCFVRVRTIVIG